jgi:hypothetical protein
MFLVIFFEMLEPNFEFLIEILSLGETFNYSLDQQEFFIIKMNLKASSKLFKMHRFSYSRRRRLYVSKLPLSSNC